MNKVLTDNQIDLIESKFETTPDSSFKDFDEILEHIGILKEDIPIAPFVLNDCLLSDPLSKSVGQNKDAENSIEFYAANKHITPSQATYDSIWTTVVLMNPKFKDYAFKRWLRDKNDKAKIKKDLANHFFCSGNRDRQTRHAVSRLWWFGYLANQYNSENPLNWLKVTLDINSDFTQQLYERSSTATSKIVSELIVKVVREKYISVKKYKRNAVRHFLKEINYISKTRNIALIPEQNLKKILSDILEKAYKV